jgi:hypothetical protein
MAVSPKFASGRYAWGICDRCGIRSHLLDLRVESTMGRRNNLRTCAVCWNDDHPQNFLPKYVQNDPQALRDPRPDTGLAQSRALVPPGNWINGQPPSQRELDQRWIEWQLARQAERDLWRMQEEQQRFRQRSFL